MVSSNGANDTTVQAAMNATDSDKKIETRNDAWGFFATLRENLKLSDAETAAAFDRAARFTAKRLGMNSPCTTLHEIQTESRPFVSA